MVGKRGRPKGPSQTSQEGVRRVIAFLREHFDEHVSLSALAQIGSMSRCHLSRSFHGAVGIPLRSYVRRLRLQRAREMLRASPEVLLTQVALDAGFYDLPHLDKTFRKEFGISPGEFRHRDVLPGIKIS